jgi:glycosyltransferase involved in cell wall biosynthesis
MLLPKTNSYHQGNDEIKCIFVCNEVLPSPRGGIGSYTINLASALHSKGIEVYVIGLYETSYEHQYPFPIITVKPTKISLEKHIYFSEGIESFVNRYKLYKQILNLTNTNQGLWIVEWPDYLGLWFRNNPNAIEIHKIHGAYFLQPYPGIPNWTTLWEGRQFQRLNNWSSVSNYYSNWVKEKLLDDTHKVFTSYIPVNTSFFKPNNLAKSDYFQIIFCGNGNTRKHPETVIKAFEKLHDYHKNVRLIFVGSVITKEQELRNMVQCQTNITFVGHKEPQQVAQLLNESSILCLPSEHESFGIAWVEAMSCGIPVIAGIGSCEEEIITSEGGFFVNPLSFDDLFEVLKLLINNNQLLLAKGYAARKIVEGCYSYDVVAKNVLEYYEELWDRRLNEPTY